MKSILITGSTGKIGQAIVKHCLKMGYFTILPVRDIDKAKSLFQADNDKILFIKSDFFNEQSIQDIVFEINHIELKPETLLFCARSTDTLEIELDGSVSSENFQKEFYMDVVFPYRLIIDLIKITANIQNIIFISSIYGVVAPNPSLYEDFKMSSPINYGVAKAAQIHLTKELAVRLAPETRVNCISFGGLEGRTEPDFNERYKSLNPLHKMLSEDTVIKPLNFLISDDSNDLTGQNIIVDGGWTIW